MDRSKGGSGSRKVRAYIPFGRYIGMAEAVPPANAILVGREAQRARFLNLLCTQGRRVACLVTGHRGSGKSTFVSYCLDRYVDDVPGRYLRGAAGHRLLWDRLGLVSLVALVSALLLLSSESSQALAGAGGTSVVWSTLAAVVCGVPAAFVLLQAGETAADIRAWRAATGSSGRLRSTSVTLLVLATVGWGLVDGWVASWWLLLPLLVTAFAACASVIVDLGAPRPDHRRLERALTMRCAFLLAVGMQLLQPVGARVLPHAPDALPRFPPDSLAGAGTWILVVTGCWVLIAAAEHAWIVRPFERQRTDLPLTSGEDEGEQIRTALRDLSRHSFFWGLHAAWLPVLRIPVNLGFEDVEYRHVVRSMLEGLREAHERAFLLWSSPFRIAARSLQLLAVVVVAFGLSHGVADRVVGERIAEPWASGLRQVLASSGSRRDAGVGAMQPGLPLLRSIAGRGSERDGSPNGSASPAIQVRVQDVLLLLVVALTCGATSRRLRLRPIEQTNERIRRAIQSLDSTVSSDGGVEVSVGWQGMTGKVGGEKLRTETKPLHPRSVEQAFQQVLQAIQDVTLRPPFFRLQVLSLPAPEIIFIFDELDKIEAPPPAEAEAESDEAERERSQKLLTLLAEMKSVIAQAPARFVFIGGRHLHDEWLADQSARRPLLTNIIDQEIYLPSLLVDGSAGAPSFGGERSSGVEMLLRAHHARSWAAYEHSERLKASHWLRVPANDGQPPVHASSSALQARPLCSDWNERRLEERELVRFLEHRSLGNVKRLRRLLEGFVENRERLGVAPLQAFDHALAFSDQDIYRIQLVASLRSSLLATFRDTLVLQDDKLVAASPYVSDFIFKFHRRAFSWTHLEHVDELIHVHRHPDMRDVIQRMVAGWQGTYLDAIRNGMHDYRVQSELAAELRYLGRVSEDESAAFNFTLDESLSLKETYRRLLGRYRGAEARQFDTALGELFELDGDFEQARAHYRRALDALEKDTCVSRESPDVDLARIRLLLQTGMTHERERNYEAAQGFYHDAGALSLRMIDGAVLSGGLDSLGRLKHAMLLYQPCFAEAWLLEKRAQTVDAAPSLVEGYLHRLRQSLPFVRDDLHQPPRLAPSPVEGRHSNFGLILADLHDKAGDLYFFKGIEKSGPTAHLCMAEQHYLVALHEIRRVNIYRRGSSGAKLNPRQPDGPTVDRGGDVDFVQRATMGALVDLADCLLAGVELSNVRRDLGTAGLPGLRHILVSHPDTACQWLEGASQAPPRLDTGGTRTMLDWLGGPPDGPRRHGMLVVPQDPSCTGLERLIASLVLRMAAAHVAELAGYRVDAMRETLRAASSINRVLWFLRIGEALRSPPSSPSTGASRLLRISMSLSALARRLGRHVSRWSCSGDGPEREHAARQQEYVALSARLLRDSQDTRPLKRALQACAYPLLYRLRYLKLRLDCDSLRSMASSSADVPDAESLKELMAEARAYDAPWQFTHLDLGVSIALHCEALRRRKRPVESAVLEAACQELSTALEAHTMRRGYYEAIADLHYLYDDFSDRRVHFSHAMDMAGHELARQLLECVDRGGRH